MKITNILKSLSLCAILGITTSSMALAHSKSPTGGGGTTPHFGQYAGQLPPVVPFICNFAGGDADGFAGYINISGVRGLVYDFQTNTYSSVGASSAIQTGFPLRSLSFDYETTGTCDPCAGPWVFVTAVTRNAADAGIYAVNCGGFPTSTSAFPGFTHVTLTPADFGLSSDLIGDFVIQLFPSTVGTPQETMITNVQLNKHAMQWNPRTLYNFCPLGFFDPRPVGNCTVE
jgi:hypothetical protein